MKWALSLLCCLNLSLGLSRAGAAELTAGRIVYLMPMAHGLDQFLADRLTSMHVFQVVTDPAKADTVITDTVGAALQSRLQVLYPPPEVKEAVKEVAKEAAKEAVKTAAEASKSGDAPQPTSGALSAFDNPSNKAEQAGSMASFGRGRGTIFLVDVKSRQVIWSIFDPPKNNSPQALNSTAQYIVKHIKETLEGK